MMASIRVYLISVLSLLFAVSGYAFAAPDNHHGHGSHHAKQFFLAPDINSSGAVVNGVDVSSGRLNHSDNDLRSSTLSFSRIYNGSGWSHQYASRLWVEGLSYNDWQGTKSHQYKKKKRACRLGWSDIKATAFNGKLSDARAKHKNGYCQIVLNGKTKATLAIHRANKRAKRSIVLTRPNGTSLTFAKGHGQWKPLSGAPFTLKKSGKNWKLSTPGDSVEIYNRWGSLIKVSNSSRQTTRLRYNHAGKLKRVTGPFGRAFTFTYSGQKIVSVTGAQGTVNYTYHHGRLSSVTKVDGSTIDYQYDHGKLSAIIDALGQTTARYSYDNRGRVTTSQGQNGTNQTDYNYAGSVITVTNVANSASDRYKFRVIKGTMKLAKTTDSDGNVATQRYDRNGYPRQSVAINGTKTRTVFNKRGLLIKRINSVGLPSQKTAITKWHQRFRKPVLQVEGELKVGNKATRSLYNNRGLLVKRIDGVISRIGHAHDDDGHHHNKHHRARIILADKRITKYRYNSKGQLTKTIAPNSAATLSRYDVSGNLTSSANALGQENKTLSFDASGNSLLIEDANGIQTSNTYDVAGRLISNTTSGRTSTYAYDTAGRQTAATYADGSTTANEYDASGNLHKSTDHDGNVSESTFDSNGNQTSSQIKDVYGNIISSSSSSYNHKNQLVQSTDAQGNTTAYEYDASGNQTKVTDAKGNITHNEYDAANRLVKTIDALGGDTTYAYDTNGNRTRVTAPNGAATTFKYDQFNQLTKEASPDRGTTTYQYDGSGNQISTTDANNNQKNTHYDLLNRITGESWTGVPDLTITYIYDSCANGVGKLCAISDKSGNTSFQYDDKGQIVEKTQDIEGIALTKTYAYNSQGQLTSETYPSGAQISYGYNVDKIVSISINGTTYLGDISYNAANQLTGWNWADGTPYTKTYDVNGRLDSFPLADKTRTLNYDSNGNITGWTDTGTAEAKNFAYDALNRLTEYNNQENSNLLQSQLFSYDANGNRLELQDDNQHTVYSILANSNRLIQVGTTNYQYDTNGNIIDDGEYSYGYDSRNRLISVDGTSSYLYNANNMRVKKTTPAGTVLYGWDSDRIYAEYDANGNPIQETVYFGSTPIALLKDSNTYRIYADQINTPRVITNDTNTTLWAWSSKPFGESAPSEDVDNDGENLTYNLRFPGQYYDEETSKHYNFRRDYNPVTGRYIQSDPIGLDGGLNTFTYVASNPVKFYDPYGLIIYIQWHKVALWSYHSLIRIIPDDQSYQSIAPIQYANEENGKWFTTIGAGPSGFPPFLGNLKKGYNRDKDVNQAKNGMVVIPTPWKGMSEKTIINKLFTAFSKYDDGLEYEVFPDIGQNEYNSNGFVNGILQSVGINIVKPYSGLSGWEVPVATAEFK